MANPQHPESYDPGQELPRGSASMPPTHSPEAASGKRDLGQTQGVDAEGEPQRAGTEQRLGRMDQAFDELVDLVKDAPEARREALRVVVAQMRMIGEGMRNLRQADLIQEAKKQMLGHWEELKTLTRGNPALLSAIQDWGARLVRERTIYYDLVLEAKRDVAERTRDLQLAWGRFHAGVGKIIGLSRQKSWGSGESLEDMAIDDVLDEDQDDLRKFIDATNQAATGFEVEPNADDVTRGFGKIGVVLRKLSTLIHAPGFEGKRPIDETPSLAEDLESALRLHDEMTQAVKDISVVFQNIKKVRDTQLLDLYQEMPEAA